ncbi:MAG: ABC transporter ATP-binding protein [Acidimicrobiales bacterium]|nr:ABC transporter ATP-binding protein [Acidimicrobiales bacterium]
MKPLSVKSVDMVYELPKGGSVHALADITFDLAAGRMLTLLGPSGCGKTTLLNIIAGFLGPTDGEVFLGGDRITGPSRERGMVFQQGALFEWLSVSKNISFGPRMARQKKAQYEPEVERLLDIVGLSGFGDKQIYELSGGMQQRVALARCLANDPEMMLMDEPLGALDALTREKMQSLILNLWNDTGKSIVMVTHSVEEALLLGDQVFVMAPRPGRIERVYELPFAHRALSEDPREIKQGADFQEVKEEILSFIWEMEEEIMGRETA